MLSKLYTAAVVGIDCQIVEVEVDYSKASHFFAIVGLGDKSVQEAKERIPSAIKNSNASFIPMKIIMNLAPAELHKTGSGYDLALAVGYLIASEQLNFDPNKKLFIGELALDGRLRGVSGILPIIDSAKKHGFTEVYLPLENANEASVIDGINIFGFNSLSEVIDHLNGNKIIEHHVYTKVEEKTIGTKLDMSFVKGQLNAKRALEIAAAGGHNILLFGTPGSGKTLLSRTFPTILPEMTIEESLEVTRVHSVAGLTSKESPLVTRRPFRSPHHTSSQIALVGGGSIPKPGEISLAHRGVLFLDEFPEFTTLSLEALRQPLEDKVVTISRAQATLTFPANFILVAAMNPCKCGYRGDTTRSCICTTAEVLRYQKKISGPVLDRIDLLISVPKVENAKLLGPTNAESSETIRERVQKARNFQQERYKESGIFSNSEMTQKEIEKYIDLDDSSKLLLDMAVSKMNLSARAYFRVLKVARTISDLKQQEKVSETEIAEALSYRVEIDK